MMGRGYDYGYNMMDNYGWGGGLLMLLFGAMVIAGIVLIIVWAVRSSGHHANSTGPTPPHRAAGHDEAISIAKRRLASGEITREQYEDIIRSLGA